jgi:hypothetical protein
LLAACGSTAGGGGDASPDAAVIRVQEAQACSTNPAEDPQLVCTSAQDLVCVATYSRNVTDPQEAMKFDGGLRQVFVCRMPCAATGDCPQPGDVCCPGQIHGKTFGKTAACVPPTSCETMPPDGGA